MPREKYSGSKPAPKGGVPPQAPDEERAVLGALMLPEESAEALAEVTKIGLATRHFYKEAHQRILEAIYKLRDKKEPVDLLQVTMQLEASGHLETVGGVTYLDEMMESVPTAANIVFYAKHVMREAARRSVLREAAQLQETLRKADSPTVTLSEVVANVHEYTANIDRIVKDEGVLSGGLPERVSVDGETFYKQKLKPPPCLIGRGLVPQHGFTLLVAYAKEGKTSLAIQMSLSIISGQPFLGTFPVENRGRVLFLHLENPPAAMHAIFKSQVDGWGAPIDKKADLVFLDGHGLCIERMEDRAFLLAKMQEVKPDLVVIDPVSLIYTRDLNDYASVRAFTETLREMSAEFDCAFLIVHHFSKPGIMKRESIHAAGGSAAWGNFAEGIIGMGRWSQNKPPGYKRLDFLLRSPPIEDICLLRNPQNLLFDLVVDPSDVAATPVETVADILEGQATPIGYTLLKTHVTTTLGVADGAAKRLITGALKKGIISKEEGKRGRYFFPLP